MLNLSIYAEFNAGFFNLKNHVYKTFYAGFRFTLCRNCCFQIHFMLDFLCCSKQLKKVYAEIQRSHSLTLLKNKKIYKDPVLDLNLPLFDSSLLSRAKCISALKSASQDLNFRPRANFMTQNLPQLERKHILSLNTQRKVSIKALRNSLSWSLTLSNYLKKFAPGKRYYRWWPQ